PPPPHPTPSPTPRSSDLPPYPASPAMIQLKPGIPPSALNKPRKATDRRHNRSAKKTNGSLHFERVFSDAAVKPRSKCKLPFVFRSEEHTSELQSQSNLVC